MSGTSYGPVVQAGSVGEVHFHGQERQQAIPYQLPPSPRLFTSRGKELAALNGWLSEDEGHPLVVVVSGPGGVGKTSLALRWLHDSRTTFRDGQLYVDLAARTGDEPTTPDEVLEWFLLALGVPAVEIPWGLARRQAAFRSLTADRSISVLLDNAVSATQVRPLLPTSPRSAVVVTSRWRLGGLAVDGARFVEVESFDENSSLELLERAVGTRVTSEPDAARELAHLCAGLPIALSVVGARLSTHPRRSLSKEVGSLRAERLGSLTLGDGVSVEAVFDVSYLELPPRHARAYRLCALHPGASFGVEVAAAAVDEAPEDVEPVLSDLVEKNLLGEVGDERFRYHDLLRLHARRHAEQASGDGGDAAVRRIVLWYLDRAIAADLAVAPDRPRVGPRYESADTVFDHVAPALDWLEAERSNLVTAIREAAERGWHALAWQVAETMFTFFLHRHHFADWISAFEVGADAARLDHHAVAEARLRMQLAIGYLNVGRSDDASREASRALELAEGAGDLASVATALRQLGRISRNQGDPEDALEYFRRSLHVEAAVGRRRGEALAHRRIGEALTDLGRHEEALTAFADAAAIMAELGQVLELARIRTAWAVPTLALDRVDDAALLLDAALPVLAETKSPDYIADALLLSADVAARRGDRQQEQDHVRAAAAAYTRLGQPVPERVRSRSSG
ncbi:NB-ARC domain-containing protein [Saccharothrix sp. HUAS TT1]|uniref:NB-ARC domain-containing protein n=1 Tax=unclassified Saccharothrix TaxID=2593673 RepID=UPI00345BB0A1